MISPLPSKEQAFQELADLIAMLYVAFPEVARERVIPYFSTRERVPNPRLFTDMCRYEVRELLLNWGIEVCDDNDADEIDLRTCLQSLKYDKLRRLPEGGVIMSHSYPSDISREQFTRILPDLESARRRTKPRTVDLYDVFCGCSIF